jgi:hypothetical protein
MSQKSFLAIEKAFCLPKATLQLVFYYQGVFSKYLEHSESGKLEKIGKGCWSCSDHTT